MSELNFCPCCDAPQHKIILCKDDVFFCRECSKFYKFEGIEMKCLKCSGKEIGKSDFPSPTGEVVFQCKKCKKAFSASEFLKANKQ